MNEPTTPKEAAAMFHNQWKSSGETKAFLLQLRKQRDEAMSLTMNLTESKSLSLEQLLPSLIKAKVLTDIINYAETNPESILRP
jgi:hypothetical protein